MNNKAMHFILFLSLFFVVATVFPVSADWVVSLTNVVITNPEGEDVLIDDATNALVSVDFEHHESHEGDHYFIKTYLEDTEGAGSINYFSFSTPENTKRIHARALLAPDVDFVVEIFEDANVSGGVALDEMNNDRDSNNTALLEAVAAPTVHDIGNLIWASRNGGGKNPVGVAPNLNYEIIAKSNSTYVFRITKQVVQTGILNVDFWWYEHTGP